MMDIKRLTTNQGLSLPPAPQPVGNYRAIQRAGNLLFISGQLPLDGTKMRYAGQLGRDLDVGQGQKAAALCALNLLSQLAALAPDVTLKSVVKLEGYINAGEGFVEHAQVLKWRLGSAGPRTGDKSGTHPYRGGLYQPAAGGGGGTVGSCRAGLRPGHGRELNGLIKYSYSQCYCCD